MIPSMPDEMRVPYEELLVQLRDLVPSFSLEGELDRDALLGALALDEGVKPAFSFSRPSVERAQQDSPIPTMLTLVRDVDVVPIESVDNNYTIDKRGLLIGGAGGDN